MSAEKAPPKDAAPAAVEKKKGGAAFTFVGILLTAALAGGASFAGARAATKAPHAEEGIERPKVTPPGPTVSLEPFVANVSDAQGNAHAVKVTFFIELEREAKEEEFKVFIPRVRDAILTNLRNQPFERFTKQEEFEKLREELKGKLQDVGAHAARQVLVTDLITQ